MKTESCLAFKKKPVSGIRMKMLVRNLVLALCRLCGTNVRDIRSGKLLGKALLIPWRGQIRVIGAESDWVPVPVPQERLTYWVQSIGFTKHDPPPSPCLKDFQENTDSVSVPARKSRILHVILDHRQAASVLQNIDVWRSKGVDDRDILLVYGGSKIEFENVEWHQKIFIQDVRLRTRDHQREKQSYREIFSKTAEWLIQTNFTHVLFVEYDQIPLARDIAEHYLKRIKERNVDVLGVEVRRIDRSLHPHWLAAVSDSYRDGPVWSMLGTGHFWRREAWIKVAQDQSLSNWYLELDAATTAVRNGFRIDDVGPDQSCYVKVRQNLVPCSLEEAEKRGAWTYHPLKTH